MTCSVLIIGLPSPAGCASNQTWRAAAAIVASRLVARFGSDVSLEYAELFSPDMARHTEVDGWIAAGEATPPIVVIDGVRRFSGGKLNVSAIERAVAELAEQQPVAPVASGRSFRSGHRSRLGEAIDRPRAIRAADPDGDPSHARGRSA